MVGGYNRHNFIKNFETTKNSQEISQHLGGMTKKTYGLTGHPYHGWLACYSDLLAKIQAKKSYDPERLLMIMVLLTLVYVTRLSIVVFGY